jgi:glyoxylate reductase
MIKALFTECLFSDTDIAQLKKKGIIIEKAGGNIGETELIKKLKNCDIFILGGSDKATKSVIESTKLRLIIFYGTGYENNVDTASASFNGIPVSNTPKANAYTVAEHCVALILDSVKNITYLNNETKEGRWLRRQAWNLENKTLGIIGMGTIGGMVAKIMRNGFCTKIIYTNKERRYDLEKELGAKPFELNKLLSKADVISLNASYSVENVGLLNRENLKLVKKNAVLVSTSRADLIDPTALKFALTSGNLSCAAFDSYYQEPTPSKENDKWGLLSMSDNKFIITPHTAYNSKEAVENMNKMVIENILSFIKDGVPKYKVN